jgi:hypothetical protein
MDENYFDEKGKMCRENYLDVEIAISSTKVDFRRRKLIFAVAKVERKKRGRKSFRRES